MEKAAWLGKKKGALKKKKCAHKKGGQPGNVNALGNSGEQRPIRNQNAKTHGFYSKHMPAEAFEIMQDIQEFSHVDLLWEQIQIQFTAIVRAQKIMFVESKDDTTKVVSKIKGDLSVDETGILRKVIMWKSYNMTYNLLGINRPFLNAQSRAMSELRGLIKQFDNIAHETDERRLKLEQMRLNIDKTKVEMERFANNEDDSSFEIIIKDKGGALMEKEVNPALEIFFLTGRKSFIFL
ncbi:phage terminase small subunit [Bacillus sp. SL00103]